MSPTNERLVYERALPAAPDSVVMVRHELDAALRRAEVDATRRDEIARVMTEAATNVVLHAYPPFAPGLLFIDAAITRTNLLLRVCDSGRGIAPRADNPGLGLGLSLMARLADGITITPNRSLGGTRVSAMFRGVAPNGSPGPRRTRHRKPLEDYVAALQAGDDTRALETTARQALDHADHLRAERLR
jgi:anti-sigma regulatory factor (Ser/Thr protein kinase)